MTKNEFDSLKAEMDYLQKLLLVPQSTLAIDLQNSELDALLAVRSLVLVVQLSQAFQIQFVILIHCVLI